MSTERTADTEDIADLSYEQARDELVAIVSRIEGGNASLEESMTLWERGEALAAHCQAKLDQAQEQLDRGANGPAGSGKGAQSDQTHGHEAQNDDAQVDDTGSDDAEVDDAARDRAESDPDA